LIDAFSILVSVAAVDGAQLTGLALLAQACMQSRVCDVFGIESHDA
jgi:hypothetical protein